MALSVSQTLRRSMSTTGQLLRRNLWIWPLIAAMGLGVLGWWIRHTLETTFKEKLASDLQTILQADVTALRIWLDSQKTSAEALASSALLRDRIGQLLARTGDQDPQPAELLQSPHLTAIRNMLQPWLETHGYVGFVLVDRNHTIVAADRDELVGKPATAEDRELLAQVFQGDAVVTRPFRSAVLLEAEDGELKAEVPTMFVAAPVCNRQDEVIAALAIRIRPQDEFTRILQVARAGESGETYAFDQNGLLLSQSRFDDQLKQIGLLVDRDDVHSILNIEIRDPGVDMSQGERPVLRRSEQPLTRMAADAIAGKSGVDVDGYRDYRGVPVFGAWTWLPEYGIGIATEVDVAEAYRPFYILRWTFWGLFALLGVAAIAILAYSVVVERMRRSIRHAVLEAKRLGQYALEDRIGAGGMGVVYRARHAMLRRPTAVKLLNVDKTNDETIARFEREVQLTSQLNHPNTIIIYDYGRTPEGVFYYAMEYLDGIPLDQLVERYGPLPEGRVISILRQICGSLSEAHGVGLIHRDIKPSNVILNRRGGLCDVVKVLDFGLVKAVASDDVSLTAADTITGTPQYLSPEAIERPAEVDHRSDIYAVGAVGYYLLTGTVVFDGTTIMEVCMQQVRETPTPPSQRLGRAVSPTLEAIILRCLAKKKEDRPASVQELMEELDRCPESGQWTQADAVAWWARHVPATGQISVTTPQRGESRPTDVGAAALIEETVAADRTDLADDQ